MTNVLPDSLTTEAVNPASARIDELDARGIVRVMNAADAGVARSRRLHCRQSQAASACPLNSATSAPSTSPCSSSIS
ncbi:MAG: hypothetical protein ACKON7_07685, partial [Planctomycetaceae bacterium]